MARLNARANAASVALNNTAASTARLQSQLFFLSFTGAAVSAALVKQSADIEDSLTLASLAASGTTDQMGELEDQTFRLAERFRELPSNVAETVREVQQLGVSTAATREEITRAAIALSEFTGEELAQPEAASTIFRLIRLTTRSQEALDQAAQSSRGFASAIALAGDKSAAGIAEVSRAVETFATLANVAQFTREDIISLAGAFTDVEEARLSRIVSSIQRLFGREFSDPEQVRRFAGFMGITVDRFTQLRAEEPAELLALFASKLSEARERGVELLPMLQEFGLTNVRTQRTLSAFIAGVSKFNSLLPDVEREIALFNAGLIDQTQFTSRLNAVLNTTSTRFEGLAGGLQETAAIGGSTVANVLEPLLVVLEGINDILRENPLLTSLLVGGAAAGTAGLIFGGTRALAARAGTLLPGGLFGPLSARIAAARAGAGAGAITAGTGTAAGIAGVSGVTMQPLLRRLGIRVVSALQGAITGTAGTSLARGILARGLVGRAALSATGVGAILAGLELAAPLFERVADALERLGDQGGVIGAAAESLAILANVIALAGDLVGRAIDEITDAVTSIPGGEALLGGLVGAGVGTLIAPGVGTAVGAAAGVGLGAAPGSITDALDRTNEKLDELNANVKDQGGDTTAVINSNDGRASERIAREVAAEGSASTTPTTVPLTRRGS